MRLAARKLIGVLAACSAVAACLAVAACAEPEGAAPLASAIPSASSGSPTSSSDHAAVTTSPSPSASGGGAPPPYASAFASARASAAATAEPSARPLSWLGVPIDTTVELPKSVKWSGAEVHLPADWSSIEIDDGMSESSCGQLAYLRAPKDPKREPTLGETKKSAIIIIATHGAVHELLLDHGAAKYLGITGGVSAEWSEPRPFTIGGVPIDVLDGKGKIGGDPAEVWQVRRKRPTSKGEGFTILVLAALRLPATDEVRQGLLAALASLTVN